MSAPATKRSKVRAALRGLSTALIVSGTLLLIDAVLTLVWEEPVSSLYADFQQSELSGELDRLEKLPLPPVERRALVKLPDPKRKLAFAARSLNRRTDDGDPVGRLRIDRIGLSTVFIEGTDAEELRRGPGHYPATVLPGQRGTVGIAGHRTTYGAPFRKIDKVRRNDDIVVTMPYGRFTYRVEQTRIVKPTDVWVVDRRSFDRLVLTACHPLYSAAERIVVFARLVRSQPRGAAA
ncbi:class E sortase [Solirubrobacter sp. CPCC 204708]|uniref:Sortase n=1 Tax=Solirubrobacter deserti TaxID=2282478 RepID=A0ABT4RC31_9ACTN|nr:sortase [Solirubrobacter deserti]MBE2317042.1 class E sortase [Solirubrobacter deserti]MDA0136066.1 sortase [Solirubrobacter deserti]